MTVFRNIELSRRYGRYIYAISSVLTVAVSTLVFLTPYAIPMCVLMKLGSIPVILYLYTTFQNRNELYFYLNLSISRNEYLFIPVVVEFIGFILFLTITAMIGNAS